MRLSPDETEVRGVWRLVAGHMEADENCRRIEALTSSLLTEVGRDRSGWDVLYIDKSDGRLWELIYPEAEMHGGGPPVLRCLNDAKAREKYSAALDAFNEQ